MIPVFTHPLVGRADLAGALVDNTRVPKGDMQSGGDRRILAGDMQSGSDARKTRETL